MFVATSVVTLLMNCAGAMSNWRQNYCNYEGAFASGVNDASSGKKMDTIGFGNACNALNSEAVQRGYREGYTAALRRPLSR